MKPELHVRSQLSPLAIVSIVPLQTLPSCPFIGAEISETSQLTIAVQLKDSVENEPGTKPTSHVAAVQSLISAPLHDVHAFTDGSDALQHPVNGEKEPPSHDTTG